MYPNQENDEKLWNEFLNGNQGALSKIYLTNVNDLYAFGCKFSVDNSLIKDCIQDLFETLIQTRTKLNTTDNVRAYLFTALKRKIVRETIRSSKFEQVMERGDYRFEVGFEKLDTDAFENDSYSKKNACCPISSGIAYQQTKGGTLSSFPFWPEPQGNCRSTTFRGAVFQVVNKQGC